MTQAQAPKIIFPDAEDLDSGDWSATSGWSAALYLVPAEESDSGHVEVTMHSGLGNIGIPERAFHGRWRCIGSYGPRMSGEGILAELESRAGELLSLAAEYRGTEWSGSNYHGQWSEDAEREFDAFELDLREVLSYWDAGDYFGANGETWEDHCKAAGVNPALGEAVLGQVADHLDSQADSDVLVSGTREYLGSAMTDWLEENPECECGTFWGEPCDQRLGKDSVDCEYVIQAMRGQVRAAGHWHGSTVSFRATPDCAERIANEGGKESRDWVLIEEERVA